MRRSLSQCERQGSFLDHYLVGVYTTQPAAFFAAFSIGGVPWFTANSNTMVQKHNESNGQPVYYKHKPSRWSQEGNTVLFGRQPSELYRFRWGSDGHETKILVNCPRVLASHEMPAAAAAVAGALRQRRLKARAEGDGLTSKSSGMALCDLAIRQIVRLHVSVRSNKAGGCCAMARRCS